MSYQINCSEFNVQEILRRIQRTDLVPSLDCIKTKAETILKKLEKRGFGNLEKIRKALGNKRKLSEIAKEESIDENVLVLFRREIEGWIVKIRSIDELDWIAPECLNKVKECGIRNAEDSYNILREVEERNKICQKLKIQKEIIEEIYGICELMRIRWLSPKVTRIIYELNYTVSKIQQADPKILCANVDKYNRYKNYYKGKLGERDINRIIFESEFVKD
jgi:hypothetical protein